MSQHDVSTCEAEVYRLRAQGKKRRAKHLAALKVVGLCAEALEYVYASRPVGTMPPFLVTHALGSARRLVPKK